MDMNLIFKSKQFQMCTFYSRGLLKEEAKYCGQTCMEQSRQVHQGSKSGWGIRTAGFLWAKAAYITGELLSLSPLTATLQLTDNHSEYTLGAHTVNHVEYLTCHSLIPRGL